MSLRQRMAVAQERSAEARRLHTQARIAKKLGVGVAAIGAAFAMLPTPVWFGGSIFGLGVGAVWAAGRAERQWAKLVEEWGEHIERIERMMRREPCDASEH